MILDLVFLSDLHLGTSPAAASEPYVAAFARFVDHLRDSVSAEGHACRLVLLGDSLDFLKVPLPDATGGPCLDSSAEAAVAKLEEIARQHALFFTTLGRCAAAGLPVDIVAGNHDIDLVRPEVQQRFRELVEQLSGCAEAGPQIRFHPWIYHVPGIAYAEHGQQHHDINCFATVLRPYVPGKEDRIDHPPAAHLTTAPGPASPFGRIRARATSGMALGRQVLALGSRERVRRRMEYRQQVLKPYAAEVALDHAAILAIDRLSDVSAVSIAARLLGKAFRRPAGAPGATQHGAYLHRAALAIHRILASDGGGVPYYVFGHTHIAEQFALDPAVPSAEYLNTGTWSPHLPAGVARRHGSPLLTFVRIGRGQGQRPVGEVLVWDDRAGAARPLAVS